MKQISIIQKTSLSLILLSLTLSLCSCLGGGSSSKNPTTPPVTPPPSPSNPRLQIVSFSPSSGSTNIRTTGFAAAVVFNNNLQVQLLTVNTGTSSDDVQLIDGSSGQIVPIETTLNSNSIAIHLLNPQLGLAGNTTHTLRISASITDIYGGTLAQSATSTFQTENIEPPFNGVVQVSINHEHDQVTYDSAGPMHSFQISFGTESMRNAEGYIPPDAQYNAVNNEPLVVNPYVPLQLYKMTTFDAEVFYAFQSGMRYYFTARACSTPNTGTLNCSDYSGEVTKDIP